MEVGCPWGKIGGVLVLNSSKPTVIIELYGSNTLSLRREQEKRKTTIANMTTSSASGFKDNLCLC